MHTDVYDRIDDDAFDILVDILLNPPEVERIDSEDFEYELTKAIIAIGQRDTLNCLKKVKSLLYIDQVRPVIIDVIGGLHHPDGVTILEVIFRGEQLSDDEITRLACALGEIRGLRALELLQKMKALYSDRSLEVLREIDIGIEYAIRKRIIKG